MRYLIGIDGGGTKTHCIIASENLEKLHECYGGPSNFLMLGTEPVAQTIAGLVKDCKEKLNIHYNQIDSIVLGTTGAGRLAEAKRLEQDVLAYVQKNSVLFKDFGVESDARIALEGAFAGKPGSILIAGTGSIMFGKDAKEKIYRIGGFGRFIGDEGSGYIIGRRGLNAVAQSFDGRGAHTLIANLVKTKFQLTTPEELIYSIYNNNFDIAAVAPLVFQAAEQGDTAALRICDEETNELITHIRAMQKKIISGKLNLTLIGGIATSDNYFARLLKRKIQELLPDVALQPPQHSPAFGAVLMAKARTQTK